MSEKQRELVAGVIEAEWAMFSGTQNAGGQAPCQQDRRSFELNRYAQAMSWSEAMLESYLSDLSEAEAEGRNLMAEKYARMMASTWPEEYARIAPLLPSLAPEVPPLIEKIMEIALKWEESLRRRYPNIAEKSRPVYSSEDSNYVTSFETYLRGELATYSRNTLELYYRDILKQEAGNINGLEVALEHMVKGYGFASLQEANSRIQKNG